MAEWSISKVFSFVIFLAMMIFFFFWLVTQVSDLGILFGFRTSHTVSNDIANLITSVSGVPGDVETTYSIAPGSNAQRPFEYEVDISSKIVCVTSKLEGSSTATRDCATHAFDFDAPGHFGTNMGSLTLRIKKSIDAATKTSCMEIEGGLEMVRGCEIGA